MSPGKQSRARGQGMRVDIWPAHLVGTFLGKVVPANTEWAEKEVLPGHRWGRECVFFSLKLVIPYLHSFFFVFLLNCTCACLSVGSSKNSITETLTFKVGDVRRPLLRYCAFHNSPPRTFGISCPTSGIEHESERRSVKDTLCLFCAPGWGFHQENTCRPRV